MMDITEYKNQELNKKWFETQVISCPNITEDTSYEVIDNNNKIKFVTKLDKVEIYEDLFKKLGE